MIRIIDLRSRTRATLLFALVLISGATCARSGECVDYLHGQAIIDAFSEAHPDSLSHEARNLLGCLRYGVDRLKWRVRERPSWRLLRNTRREYRDLSRYPGVKEAVTRMCSSQDTYVRSAATIALALYGAPIDPDTLSIAIPHLATRAMVFAFIGDSTGVEFTTEAYNNSDDLGVRIMLLDALYYQSTPAAKEFIARVAADAADPAAERARWMLQHPFDVEASWRL